ncbi:MAG TPA: VCBS repeat-containing protein, partial [Gemmatimonadaceae bacterium]|nr:VCBS repeat-containing protein [Gemmatimonadaceae bacterium]
VGWKTGVTMADVNGDGWIDIFVCGVDYLGVHGRNVLYINNGDGTFTDRTREYGLEFHGYSTQALFFDYDGDGDLDMYLLNHSVHDEHGAGTGSAASRLERNPRAGDRLYRNDHGHFVDVSAAAGIYGGAFGYGLGVVASDFDGDGCPDLYVANDFQEDDFLYHNNCNGTFTEVGAAALRHTSRSSMGVDAADFNNDGRTDIVTADMLPEREDILKSSATLESYGLYNLKLQAGYHPQFARNTLQLNRGTIGPATRFSDVGFLAGIAATDWSWAPLFADLDNDGRKDLFITSGIYRRPNDLDYLGSIANPAVQAALRGRVNLQTLTLTKRMPSIPVPNHAFRNNGNLTFANVSEAWGLTDSAFSNGAAYVDLNNSGALDLVVNRINAPALIYRNHARDINRDHYLRVALRGQRANTGGIGARVTIWQGSEVQVVEQMPTRGFESSVDPRLHFGLGATRGIDSLLVEWPGGAAERLQIVAVDQTLTLSQSNATRQPPSSRKSPPLVAMLADVSAQTGITWRHRENDPLDFVRQPLLPHVLSAEGPAIAVGDVNGDGLDDLYVGGAKWQPGVLYLQRPDGTFQASEQPAFRRDSLFEDVDALFFDANGDGHPDLYVVSGGNEFAGRDDALQDRLYINDGHGHFERDTTALPRMSDNGARVVAGDFNKDGHIDLFVGRRAVTGAYGIAPRSYLLENDGHGHFTDVTSKLAPGLVNAGMVTSAAWVDYDGDGALDLIVAGEWMPVRVFHQENGRFVERARESGFDHTNGWWNDLTVADLDGDGRPDLVLGNLGLNSFLTASRSQPARLYVGDFAHDRGTQAILTAYRGGVSYPVASRDELALILPDIQRRFPTYTAFGASRIEDIVDRSTLDHANVLQAYDFATSIAINNGKGGFTLRPLPMEAQLSPVFASLATDIDGDGHTDLILAGNQFGVPPVFGRYDASYGLLLRGDGHGSFAPVDLPSSGLVLDGEVRHIRALRQGSGSGGRRLVVVARNDQSVQVLRVPTSALAPKGP